MYKNYKIIALVPARGGSKGIKLKNLKRINNQTLIEIASKFIDKLDGLGKTLGTVSSHYEELTGTRRRALEKPMDKIEELQLGQGDEPKELNE